MHIHAGEIGQFRRHEIGTYEITLSRQIKGEIRRCSKVLDYRQSFRPVQVAHFLSIFNDNISLPKTLPTVSSPFIASGHSAQ